MEFIKDYECVINYHSRKSNVVTNALSRKNKIMIGGFLIGDKKELLELANLGVELIVEIRGRIIWYQRKGLFYYSRKCSWISLFNLDK